METERKLVSGRKQGPSNQKGLLIGVATVIGLSLVSKIVSILRGGNSEKSDEDYQKSEKVLSNGNDAITSSSPMQAVVESDDKLATLDSSEPSVVVRDEDVKSLEAVLNSPPQPPAQGVSALPSPDKLFEEVEKDQMNTHSSGGAGDVSVTVVEKVVENGETVSSTTTHMTGDQLEGLDSVDKDLKIMTEPEVMPSLSGEDAGNQVTQDEEKQFSGEESGKPLVEDEQRHSNAEVAEKNHADDEPQVEDVGKHSKVEDVEQSKTEYDEKNKTGDAETHIVEDGEKHSIIEEEEKHSNAQDAEEHFEIKEEEKHSNGEHGVKHETEDTGKHDIVAEEISSNGEVRGITGDEVKDLIKDEAKHQSEDDKELSRAEGEVTLQSVEGEKITKSESEVEHTTEDVTENGVKNDTGVSKKHDIGTEEDTSL